MNFWKTKQFKEIQVVWEQKLKDSGFVDIEHESGHLKNRATNSYHQANDLERDTRLTYFLKVGANCSHGVFESDLEKKIMLLHSEGATIEEIVRLLTALGHKTYRRAIRITIRKYLITWKMKPIRVWPQMSRKKTLTK